MWHLTNKSVSQYATIRGFSESKARYEIASMAPDCAYRRSLVEESDSGVRETQIFGATVRRLGVDLTPGKKERLEFFVLTKSPDNLTLTLLIEVRARDDRSRFGR